MLRLAAHVPGRAGVGRLTGWLENLYSRGAMTPDQAAGLLQFLQPQILQEFEATRRVLAAVPDEKADYKPHPTSMSARELATHIVSSEIWFLESIVNGEFKAPDETPFKSMKASEARVL